LWQQTKRTIIEERRKRREHRKREGAKRWNERSSDEKDIKGRKGGSRRRRES
jgi:hypothetical protein